MARRHSRFVRSAPKTKMWIGAGVGNFTVPGSSSVLVSTLTAGALLLLPFTILRMRMLVTWRSDQAAVSERPFGAYGKIVVTQAAAAIGVTAIPDPSGTAGDPEAAWFIWQAFYTDFNFLSSIGFQEGGAAQYVVDSKSMRKVGIDDQVVAVATNDTSVGGIVNTNGRMLVQLH